MRLLHLTLLYCMLNVFSADPAWEYQLSSPTKSLIPIASGTNPTTTKDVVPGATNIILQSKDGGQTWQDISSGLPELEQPEGFFAGESGIYLRVNEVMYHSEGNLNTPVWKKSTDRGQDWKQVQQEGIMNIVESKGVLIATGQNGIKRSTDNGEHWEWVISEGGVGIAVERIDGGFAAISYNTKTKSRRIRISLDDGKTWQAIDEGLQPSASISSIKQVGNYLLCGHPDGIFRSSDLGNTWYIVHPSVEVNFGNMNVPSRDNRKVFKLYVSGKVLYAVASNSGC